MKYAWILLLFTVVACSPKEPSVTSSDAASPPERPLGPASEPMDIGQLFSPTGYMGDGEYGTDYIKFLDAVSTNPHSPPDSVAITYTFGPKGWGGIYWLNKADNWGQYPGADLSDRGYTQISFWARGAKGGEKIQFIAGGIDKAEYAHKDSFPEKPSRVGRVTLSNKWAQYKIDLTGEDLSSVLGGFGWVANSDQGGSGVQFYLDDILFE